MMTFFVKTATIVPGGSRGCFTSRKRRLANCPAKDAHQCVVETTDNKSILHETVETRCMEVAYHRQATSRNDCTLIHMGPVDVSRLVVCLSRSFSSVRHGRVA